MSAVHWAVMQRNPRQVRLLARAGSGVNRRDSSMRTPMHLVSDITNENLASSIAKILLQNGARVSQRNGAGVSAFLYACTQQRTQLVELMIHEREIDWTDVDHHGNTALHLAVANGNRTLTRMIATEMMKYKLDVDQRNAYGDTARSLASKYGHTECADALRDLNRVCVTEDDHKEQTSPKERGPPPSKTRSLKLSSHFRNRFPEVCNKLEKIQRQEPIATEVQGWTETAASNHDKGRSIKLHAVPRLIELYREQFMTSYRPPVKPRQSEENKDPEEKNADKRKISFPPHLSDGTDEHLGAAGNGRRRKCTSFAGLPFHRHPGEHRAESRMRRFSTVVPPSQKAAPGSWRG